MKAFAPLAALAALLALSACAPTTHWEKPSAGSDAASADLADCRHQAQAEAFRRVDRYGYGAPMWRYSPYADPTWSRANYERWVASERLSLQVRLTNDCMRSKGYDRVPNPPAS